MVSQTTMNGHPLEEATSAVGEHVASLTWDLVSLAELQGRLFVMDVRESCGQAARPAALVAAGTGLLLGAIPVLMLGLIQTLSDRTALTWEGACWIVAMGAIALAALAIGFGTYQLRRASQALSRSHAEFQENLRWIKKVVLQASTSGKP